MGLVGSKWHKMAQHILKEIEIAPNCSSWVQIGSKCVIVGKMVQMGPNRSNWVQMDLVGWPLKPGSTWFLFNFLILLW